MLRALVSMLTCILPYAYGHYGVWGTYYNRVMHFAESIFATRFHITRGDLEGYLAEALSQGGDYADLYFEYLLTSSIGIDESMVKSAAQGVSMGVGVRVISGERTGYAYSDDLSPERI